MRGWKIMQTWTGTHAIITHPENELILKQNNEICIWQASTTSKRDFRAINDQFHPSKKKLSLLEKLIKQGDIISHDFHSCSFIFSFLMIFDEYIFKVKNFCIIKTKMVFHLGLHGCSRIWFSQAFYGTTMPPQDIINEKNVMFMMHTQWE